MVERKQLVTRIVLWVLVIGIMVGIFCFSNQKSVESMELSDGLLYDIVRFLKLDVPDDVMAFLSVFIRKVAHFSVYAALGACVYALLEKGYFVKQKASLCITPLICAIYAITDEVHQLFVAGRSGAAGDVLIDTSGSIAGMLVIYGAIRLFARRKKND